LHVPSVAACAACRLIPSYFVKENAMKRTLAALLASFAWLTLSGPAQAGQVADIKATLNVTRQHTMAMLSEDDRAVLEMRYEEALASSKDLDALLGAALKSEALSAIRPKLMQFQIIWDGFKQTRDEEVIPALLAGARDKARDLAQRVQAPRFKQMSELLESLPQ
jgi:hypothetical protein